MNTPLDLAQLKKLCEEAQPGEWRACRINGSAYVEQFVDDKAIDLICELIVKDKTAWPKLYQNFAFIAAARTAVPALIAAYEGLGKDYEKLYEEHTNLINSANVKTIDKLKAEVERLRTESAELLAACDKIIKENDQVYIFCRQEIDSDQTNDLYRTALVNVLGILKNSPYSDLASKLDDLIDESSDEITRLHKQLALCKVQRDRLLSASRYLQMDGNAERRSKLDAELEEIE